MTVNEVPTRAEDMFCYGIYAASHVINRAYTPLLNRLGLTYPQYITLTLLWERDRQKVTELAGKLRMQTSTLTPLLQRLETQGLVKRSRDKQDGRAVIVSLTDPGRVLQRTAPDITACMIKGTTLSLVELKRLQHLLTKLTAGLDPK
ncbi:transcriptional regulator [Tateyamaria omphalii]|uniref:MarR family winged helix-turn-helix transcriptional regulator n=1 Tax=Tateyamaria omphalii TaxID=299262 RepID=UPI001997E07B|nr:MarR family transcriptional regulator [Tateyamaria omphalii]GGX71297.1 transcriptional regulator [Tateyamaria omphalii]